MLTVNRPTAFGLSAVLHVSLLCVGLFAWPFMASQQPVHVTPVTLLTSTRNEPLRAAEEAPAPQEAQVVTPEPAAPIAPPPPPKPEPVVKPPAPPPAPPKVAPSPKPVAKVAPPTPSRTAAVTGANPKPVNLDALAQSLAKTAPAAPSPPSGAKAGPTQAELDAEARQAEGQARAAMQDAFGQIVKKIGDAWNVSCANSADLSVVVRLRIDLNADGGLVRAKLEDYPSIDAIQDARVRAAALSALSAAQAAAPFSGLPKPIYGEWRSRVYRFPASDICAQRQRKL